MGIIEEYVNSSPDKKLEWIKKADEAISRCSKRELKGRLKLIRDIEKEIKKSISPEDFKKLTELSLEIQNLVKLCVMTGASNEREIKLEHFDCKLCGNCCRESFPILVQPEEIDKITSKYGKLELNNIVNAHINDIWGNLTEEAKMENKIWKNSSTI